ncbi:AAA family ATPase [Butyrivibrio sp. WCD2001]|uniref:AAA family ATPase n=1 Tax=Butyrivibrio sp. WCD2001 TaxID=1280681 RepID=UPI0003FD97D7|nr:AAA family ATPase [Butyrivibrio sp. WCD2001]
MDAISEIYAFEENKNEYSKAEVLETLNFFKENDFEIQIPEFFKKIIAFDLVKESYISRLFIESLKLIMIEAALIDSSISFEESRYITRICKLFADYCDKKGVMEHVQSNELLNDFDRQYKQNEDIYNKSNNNSKISTTKVNKPSVMGVKSTAIIEDNESAFSELKALIGLESVKEEIESIANFVKLQKLRQMQNLPAPDMSYHLVFTGNPGTGKTTVARLLAKIYKDLGVVSEGQLIEAKSSDLIAGYVGQTAIKTHEVIEKAKGGVLFIDEAYTLVDKTGQGFGQEAIDTLLKDMEDYRDDLAVIVAGYDDLMEEFINSNPGLKSRFNRYIHFDDYSEEELQKIFFSLCEKHRYILSDTAKEKMEEYFKWIAGNSDANFGNGRGVRNIFEKILENQANRIAKDFNTDVSKISIIEDVDIEWEKENDEYSLDEALSELNSLIGLDVVKKEINELIDYLKVQKRRSNSGLPSTKTSLHMVFTGNPGTGKTTVARIVARIFYSLDLLSSPKLTETDRSGLVAGYEGQTAIKTKEVIDKSMGGVLFIDEAYTLSNQRDTFGQEAIDVLLKEMEDHRDELVVIVAGYDDLMNEFINSNPGLHSRFNRFVHFEDYSSDELARIFDSLCAREKYVLEDAGRERLLSFFKTVTGNSSFGNGRGVRNLFERIIRAQATRVAKLDTDEGLTDISEYDVEQGIIGMSNLLD